MINKLDNPLVFSTEVGRIREEISENKQPPKSDGIIRILLQTKGRKGKGVSIITGFELTTDELKLLATELKKRCSCGGAIKDFTIEIQGDKRQEIKSYLENKGYKVKLAGG